MPDCCLTCRWVCCCCWVCGRGERVPLLFCHLASVRLPHSLLAKPLFPRARPPKDVQAGACGPVLVGGGPPACGQGAGEGVRGQCWGPEGARVQTEAASRGPPHPPPTHLHPTCPAGLQREGQLAKDAPSPKGKELGGAARRVSGKSSGGGPALGRPGQRGRLLHLPGALGRHGEGRSLSPGSFPKAQAGDLCRWAWGALGTSAGGGALHQGSLSKGRNALGICVGEGGVHWDSLLVGCWQ